MVSSPRTWGVNLIAIFLLISALGSVFVGIYYWDVLHNPLFYEAMGRIDYFLLSEARPDVMVFLTHLFIIRYVNFLAVSGRLVFQVVFYPLLSVLLVAITVGLVKMMNWARIATVVYFIISIAFAFFFLFPEVPLNSFNINILTALIHAAFYSLDPYYYTPILLVSLILGITVPVYLSGDVKYEFE